MSAAERYAAMIDARDAQQARLRPEQSTGDRWGGGVAARFRADPHRVPEPNLEALLALVEPGDVVVDVGGGSGRIGLPIALRCRTMINVDPSPAMQREFAASAAEAGITNVASIASAWPPAAAIAADVVLTANVTYFVRDIVPFIEAMQRAARRRVMICVWNDPPPMRGAPIFRAVHGEDLAPVPSYRELLPVLWEMDILPDVRVLPATMRRTAEWPRPTREEAIAQALRGLGLTDDRSRVELERRFDEVFVQEPGGFAPTWGRDARELLITWQTDRFQGQ
jgi:hypothetical protein